MDFCREISSEIDFELYMSVADQQQHIPTPFLLGATKAVMYAFTLAPIFFWRSLIFPFETSKGFFVIFLAQALLLLFVWLVYAHPEFRPRLGAIGKLLALYIAILFAASLMGLDFSMSFWGTAARVTSLMYWIHLFAVFVVVSAIFRTKRDWIQFFSFSVCVSVLVAFIHLVYLLGGPEIVSSNNGSTMGNSTYLGVYLLFHIFFALFVALEADRRWTRRFGWVAGLFVWFVLLYANEAHAAIYASVGGVVFFLALALIRLGKQFRVKIFGWLIIAVLALTFSLVAFMALVAKNNAIRSYISEISSESRLVIWDIAWQGIKERPILGWGLEQFQPVYFTYFNPCLGSLTCGSDSRYDRAHNILLDQWIDAGIVGLMAYISLLVSFVFLLWRSKNESEKLMERSRKPSSAPDLTAPVFTALLAAYFVQNLTIFDSSTSLLFFVLILAAARAYARPEWNKREVRADKDPGQEKRSFVPVMVTLLLPVCLYFFVVKPVEAMRAVRGFETADNPQERAEFYEKAFYGSKFGEQTRQAYLVYQKVLWLWEKGPTYIEQYPAYIQQELQQVRDDGEFLIESNPVDPRSYTLAAVAYQLSGRLLDPVYFQEAERVLHNGISRNPQNPAPYLTMVSLLLEQSRIDEAFSMARELVNRSPDVANARYALLVTRKFLVDQAEFDGFVRNFKKKFPQQAYRADALLSLDRREDLTDIIYLPGRF